MPQQGSQLLRRYAPYRTAEHRPHGGPDGFGAEGVRAAAGQQQAVGVKGVQGPQHRSHVAGVLDPVQHHISPARKRFRHRQNGNGADEQHPLGRFGRTDGGHDLRRHQHLPDMIRQRPVPGQNGYHGPHVCAPLGGLPQQLGAVAQAFAGLAAVGGGPRQLADMGHQRVLAAGNGLHASRLLLGIRTFYI